jgi:uncharacterized membrane protein YhaH (DUF805 family)
MQQASTFGRRGVQAPSPPVRTAPPSAAYRSAPPNPVRVERAPAPPPYIVWLLTSFEGRARRRDYWLACIGISVVTVVAEGVIRAVFPHYPTTLMIIQNPAVMFDDSSANLIPALLMLLVTVPAIYTRAAVIAKRWHDRGRSAWFTLFSYVPLVNLWPLIELGFIDGQPGENRFGQSPKSPGVDLEVFS